MIWGWCGQRGSLLLCLQQPSPCVEGWLAGPSCRGMESITPRDDLLPSRPCQFLHVPSCAIELLIWEGLLRVLAPSGWAEKGNFPPEYTGAGFFPILRSRGYGEGGGGHHIAVVSPAKFPSPRKNPQKNPQEFERLSWG